MMSNLLTFYLTEKKLSKKKQRRLERIASQAEVNKELKKQKEPSSESPVHASSKQGSISRMIRKQAREKEDAEWKSLSPKQKLSRSLGIDQPEKQPYSSEAEAEVADPSLK